MTDAEFRYWGHRLIDWIADYWATVEDLPVQPAVTPGEIRAELPDRAPEHAEPFEAIMADLNRIVLPGLTHWQSPKWFAYFPGNASPGAVLGELVSAGLGQQGMLWSTSPAATEIEAHVLDWMVDLLGLPTSWKTSGPGGGVIQMSASDATHLALVVARERAGRDADTASLVAYASREAHSSFEKGARIAGFRHVRAIDVAGTHALSTSALDQAIAADIAAGLRPVFVCSTVGTTGTTAVDPVRAVGVIAREHGMWHHVDAAFAGSAMICPEFRHHQDGLDLVDSYVFNPHKWMFVNFDCSVFWVADRAPLIATMSITPPYLRNQASEAGSVIDYRDWHVALGRRFRALKLWFVLRTFGAEGLRARIREHVEMAAGLAERIGDHPSLTLVAPTPFSLVSFRHIDGDEATDRLTEAINHSGAGYVTASTLDGARYIRVSIGQTFTDARHVDGLWEVIAAATS